MDLAEMEGKCHPDDWLEVYMRHTPYQWQLQLARYKIRPFGDRRKDLRAGWNTARRIESTSADKLSFDKVKAIAEQATNYIFIYYPKDELE